MDNGEFRLNKNRNFNKFAVWVLIIIIMVAIFEYMLTPTHESNAISYSEFLRQIDNGRVKNIAIVAVENTIQGFYTDGREFHTIAPADNTLIAKLKDKNIEIKAELQTQPSILTSILINTIPFGLLILFWIFMLNQQPGGNKMLNFGRSKAKLNINKTNKITFADVAGSQESKQELEEIVEFLKKPSKFIGLGARIPKGVLLFGSPGTGKTLLAKAVAGEADVPFYSISGSDFVEMFVGVGASRVRDLFDSAKKNTPCIVFIDEIDAVGRHRGAGLGGGHDEREQTLNQLLVEMDGFGINEGVIVIAATNRPDILDPALLRPGRFDRHVVIDIPDIVGREAILRVHIKSKPLADNVDINVIARRTSGFTGADLSNLFNEAALLAARRNKLAIGMKEMEEAVERVIAGPERKSKVISEYEKKLTAYHESGHALIGILIPNGDPVHKVSIIPRGRAGGYTLVLPKEDKYYATQTELKNQLKILLAGRIAEELVLKEISTGAQNDLQKATELSRKMIMDYGMSKVLGPIAFGKKHEQIFLGRDITADKNYSEEVAKTIDSEVRQLIEEAYKIATDLLTQNIKNLHLFATNLIEYETLEAEELLDLLEQGELSQKKFKNP